MNVNIERILVSLDGSPLRWVCLDVSASNDLERSRASLATVRTVLSVAPMRCQYVGANVSPMRGMLSPATMPIKPELLS